MSTSGALTHPAQRPAAAGAPNRLTEPPPGVHGLSDTVGLWGLGINLLLPVAATLVVLADRQPTVTPALRRRREAGTR